MDITLLCYLVLSIICDKTLCNGMKSPADLLTMLCKDKVKGTGTRNKDKEI